MKKNLMFLFVFGVLVGSGFVWATCTIPRGVGDWTIDAIDDCTIDGVSMAFQGNLELSGTLTITNGGKLSFLDCPSYIYIYSGGTLIIEGSGSGIVTFDTSGSDCCVYHSTPGCDDPVCEDAICSADSFCCDDFWDSSCVDTAFQDVSCSC